MTTAPQKNARNKYNRANLINKTVSLNRNTESDIIDFLESLNEPFGGYVKKLIREDISKQEKK